MSTLRPRPLVLICDDDAEFLRSIQLGLRSQFDLHTANSVTSAKKLMASNEYDIAIVDLNFEGQEHDGVYLLDHFSKTSPGTYLIVLSGDESVRRVVEAMRRKLFEFIHKDGEFFIPLQAAMTRCAQLWRAKSAGSKQFLTESPRMRELLKSAERILASHSDAPILILGETGTGKEFLARHIADTIKQRLVAANMAAIPRDTAESVLFGHERGAFTGATENKIGLIETANQGIFFLDEIGEASAAVQAKLLRVLQEKEVLPLGSVRSRKVHVRFIAATHQNLEQMIDGSHFRQDLLQRLNTFVLRIPSLRERPEDVIFYANIFLKELGDEQTPYFIAPDGIQELLVYPWPGNVRELKSVIQRIVVLSDVTVINAQAVIEAIRMGNAHAASQAHVPFKGLVAISEGHVRRDQLLRALHESNGSKRQAARTLGISEATIYRWIQQFGLTRLGSTEQAVSQEKASC